MFLPQDNITGMVFENYRKWKGEPNFVHHTQEMDVNLSPHFAILQYTSVVSYHVFCTVGASYQLIPQSQQKFKNPRGVRYEYLLHGVIGRTKEICDLLYMIAAYPFRQNIFYYSGFVLPMGTGKTVSPSSAMEFIYFTYPYEDDPRIYEPPSWGEIKFPDLLIQTLWVIPIYRSEALFIRQAGPQAFEDRCAETPLQFQDFNRKPLI